jgi:hypothetical protein
LQNDSFPSKALWFLGRNKSSKIPSLKKSVTFGGEEEREKGRGKEREGR